MSYRTTDAPDDSQVEITLTIGQMKILDQLVGLELGDAERGTSPYEERPLQRLCDILWKHPGRDLRDQRCYR